MQDGVLRRLRHLVVGVEDAVLAGIATAETQHSVTIDRAASTLLVVVTIKLGDGKDPSGSASQQRCASSSSQLGSSHPPWSGAIRHERCCGWPAPAHVRYP
jgi:hypothetical protein